MQTATETCTNLNTILRENLKRWRQSEGGTLSRCKIRRSHKFTMHGSAPVKRIYKRDTSAFDKVTKLKKLPERSALRSGRAAAQVATIVRKGQDQKGGKPSYDEFVYSNEDQKNVKDTIITMTYRSKCQ